MGAFHQIPVSPSDITKTTVIAPFCLYEFVNMPFDLRYTAQTFQWFMDQVLHGVSSAYTYIDDVLIASSNLEQHLQDLRTVFERLLMHDIVINPNKCLLSVKELNFLGHQLIDKVSPLSKVQNFPQPQS